MLQFASSYRVICVKMRGNSIHFTRQSEWSCIAQGRKQGLTPSPLLRKNEGKKASPPTFCFPRFASSTNSDRWFSKERGVMCSLIIFYLYSISKAHYSPPSLGRGWGRGFLSSLFLGEKLGRGLIYFSLLSCAFTSAVTSLLSVSLM